jgi:o-succinylbenzoate synthase
MQLSRLVLREILLPLVEPFRTATHVTTDRRILLLTLTDTDGNEAWSECVAESHPSYSPETVDTCWFAITEWLSPLILGHSFGTATDVHPLFERKVRGHAMAKAAIEMGMWALEAEQRQTPLAALLASSSTFSRERNIAPCETVETGIALGMFPTPDTLASRAREAVTEGYCRIKLKIAPGSDYAFVKAVREAVGPEIRLAVDANCSYEPLSRNLQSLLALDELALTMIEQPLAAGDLVHHAELQRKMTTPICLDESIGGLASVESMLALGSGKVVNLKPGRVGGFTESIAIHAACARAGIPVWCGGMLETGIGRAYNVALASLPNFTEPGDLSPGSRYWQRDVVTPPWTMNGRGLVRVPLDRPGIGVDVDADFIDNLTVRQTVLDAR